MLKKKTREAITGYLFILPNLINLVCIISFTVIFSLVISFTDWDMIKGFEGIKFIGIKNYIDMFSDKWFIDSFLNNIFFLLGVPIQIFIALLLAIVLNGKVYGAKQMRTIFFMPYVTNLVIIVLIWSALLNPNTGIINNILRTLSVDTPPVWLGSSFWVKPTLFIIFTWQYVGYYMILYMGGLQSIPDELYEASDIDGAGKIRQFISITFPMISPTTFFILILGVISTFQMWANIQILTAGGPGTSSSVLSYYIYKAAFAQGRMGYAASMAWVLFGLVFMITLLQWRGQKKWVSYM